MELVPEPAPGVEGDEVGAGLEGLTAGRVTVLPRDGEVFGAPFPRGVPIAGLESGLKLMAEERLGLRVVINLSFRNGDRFNTSFNLIALPIPNHNLLVQSLSHNMTQQGPEKWLFPCRLRDWPLRTEASHAT